MRTRQNRSAILWAWVMGICIAIVPLFSLDLSAQCQMCRTALTQSAEGQRWSHGINAGIMLLLAAPFLIAGSGLLVIYHAQLLSNLRRIRTRFFPNGAYRRAGLIVPPYSDN